MREIFDILARIQQKRNIQLLIIGAWALEAHQFSRFTADVDCMTAVENEAVLDEDLVRAGFECFDEKPAFRRYRHRLDAFMVLDVMRVDAATFAKMVPAAKEFAFLGIKLRVPGLPHLIALKLHASRHEHRTQKDLQDVDALLKANPGVVSPAELRQLCDQCGSPEIAARLSRWL